MGISDPKTIKMVGIINGQEVVVMVDPGATHNFISLEAVKKSGVTVLPSNPSMYHSEQRRQCGLKVNARELSCLSQKSKLWRIFFHSPWAIPTYFGHTVIRKFGNHDHKLENTNPYLSKSGGDRDSKGKPLLGWNSHLFEGND